MYIHKYVGGFMLKRGRKSTEESQKPSQTQERPRLQQPYGNSAFAQEHLNSTTHNSGAGNTGEESQEQSTSALDLLLSLPAVDGSEPDNTLLAQIAASSGEEVAEHTPQDIAAILSLEMRQRKDDNSVYEQLYGCRDNIETLQQSNPAFEDIPTENLMAIQGYSKAGYFPINHALRNPESSSEDLATYDNYMEGIKAGLEQLPPYLGRVYRGANVYNIGNPLSAYTVGASITEPAFVSTTKSYSVFLGFKDTVNFVIESKTGRLVEEIAHDPSEEEVLFRPGTSFTITNRQEEEGVVTIWMSEN